jgi:hypothetical protein
MLYQFIRSTCLLMLSCMTMASYALPFNIVPLAGTVLPTTVLPGQVVTAYYTVINQTASTRVSNFVKYLPPNVTQVTTNPSVTGLCGSTFTLSANGTPGSACTLMLNITGPVNANDPDPHHHLFVCFPGGISCAGTNYPLNLTVQTPPTQTRAYVSELTTPGDILLCQITPAGTFSTCSNATPGATLDGPGLFTFNSSGTKVYIPEFDNTTGTRVSVCDYDAQSGLLNNCGNAAGDGTSTFIGPIGIAINATDTKTYISSLGTNRVDLCSINSTGLIVDCAPTGFAPDGTLFTFSFPLGITLDNSMTHAYMGQAISNEVISCNVNPVNEALVDCASVVIDGSGNFQSPAQVAFNKQGSRAYISDNGGTLGTSVSTCSVQVLTGKFYGCTDSGVGAVFNAPAGLVVNAANTLLYVANNVGGTVSVCNINPTTGLLSTCVDTGAFNAPGGIVLR